MRGIKVSESWRKFENFYNDMGDRPKGKTLERVDTNSDYSKENCIWADWVKQATNKRVSKRWEVFGVVYESAKAAGEALGEDKSSIHRKAHGYHRKGKFYPPVSGYSATLLYANAL